jgi:hypothetical protein
MVYRKRPDELRSPGPLLAVMRQCRGAMTDAANDVQPMGVIHHALGVVISALDALAMIVTGRQDYFWHLGGGATEGERQRQSADEAQETAPSPSVDRTAS